VKEIQQQGDIVLMCKKNVTEVVNCYHGTFHFNKFKCKQFIQTKHACRASTKDRFIIGRLLGL
jgi:hypothetical protein